jgi:hypothetical protein
MVYQHPRWEGSAGVASDPASPLGTRSRAERVGLGAMPTLRAGRVHSGWKGWVRRQGGGADEPVGHPASVVTVNGVETADTSSSREAVNTMPGCGEPPELADDDASSRRATGMPEVEMLSPAGRPLCARLPSPAHGGDGQRVAIIGTGERRPGRT